jgi:predicted branched-subunit amino acid permease
MTSLLAGPRTRDGAGSELLEGAREMLPLLAAVTPIGLVFGVTVAESGASHLAGWSTSWLVYGASAQLAAVTLLSSGASALVVVASVAVIQLRLALYSTALSPHWRGTTRRWRALATYLLIDPSFLVGMQSYDGRRPTQLAHLRYLGGAVLLWIGWQVVTAVGVMAGEVVPAAFDLDFIAPLYMIALVVPAARTPALRAGAGTAVVAAVAVGGLPLHLGPAVGMVTGLLVGSRLAARSS